MDNRDKLEKIKEKWNDSYFILLGIFDHLNECLWIYQNEYKTTKHSNNLYKELQIYISFLKYFLKMAKNIFMTID